MVVVVAVVVFLYAFCTHSITDDDDRNMGNRRRFGLLFNGFGWLSLWQSLRCSKNAQMLDGVVFGRMSKEKRIFGFFSLSLSLSLSNHNGDNKRCDLFSRLNAVFDSLFVVASIFSKYGF